MSEPDSFLPGYVALADATITGGIKRAEAHCRALGYQWPFTKRVAEKWTDEGGPLDLLAMQKDIEPGLTALVYLTGAGILGTIPWGYLIGPTAEERGIAHLAVRTGITLSVAEKLEKLAQVESPAGLTGLGFRVRKLGDYLMPQQAPA